MQTHDNSFGLSDSSLLVTDCFIDGRWCGADDGKTFSVVNPATGRVIAHVPDMGQRETQRAIDAASRALSDWRGRAAKERAVILHRWFELIGEARNDLARLLTVEQGKPLSEALAEVNYGASFVEWFAEEAKRVYGDVIPASRADRRLFVIKQPIGVCAVITPWNFPNAMLARKLAPALAAGCTVVAKPAEQTPLSAFALVELARRAGVPDGVLNVITGDAPTIGRTLTASDRVRKLSFTGSTEVGKLLMQQCAAGVKKISLELGGHAPFIVLHDADVDAAVSGAIVSKFRNAGQTCVCANRFIVHEKIHDEFVNKLVQATRSLVVGNGLEPGVAIGPLVDEPAVAKVRRHIDDALTKGATLACGGKGHPAGPLFFEPTVLGGANANMLLAREETFGPVAPVFQFRDDDAALCLANDTEYGLAAYLYGRDIRRVWRMAERLEYGIVGVNDAMPTSEVAAPFGGVKQSGVGREASKYGIDEYLEMKYVCLGAMA